MRAGRMGNFCRDHLYRSPLHTQPVCLVYKGTSIIYRLLNNG
jgi:hypothetical protein